MKSSNVGEVGGESNELSDLESEISHSEVARKRGGWLTLKASSVLI